MIYRTDSDDDIIHRYTRADAIKDGELVDVSELAKPVGVNLPAAMSRALHELIKEIWIDPQGSNQLPLAARLTKVLKFFVRSAGMARHTQTLLFRAPDEMVNTVSLKAIIGPGDTSDPVITLMLPEED